MSDYRFIQNSNAPISALIHQLQDECVSNMEDQAHYLAIHDTSEINLSKHQKRLNLNHAGIGRVGTPYQSKVGLKHQKGFYIHPTMLVNSQTQSIAGFVDVDIWTRELEQDQEQNTELPKKLVYTDIETKESFKWIKASKSAGNCVEQAKAQGRDVKVTLVSDRESDLYEYFHQRPANVDVLVRVRCDRLIGLANSELPFSIPSQTKTVKQAKLEGVIQPLYTYLAEQPVQGKMELMLEADPRHHRTARVAQLEVRFSQVLLLPPKNLKRNPELEYAPMPVYVIEAREDPESIPEGQEAVLWRLMTTHQIDSFESTLLLITWYKLRWLIELFFAALKGSGLQLEECLLERGLAVQRLMLLGFPCAAMILQLQRSRENQFLEARIVFSKDEIMFLEVLTPKFEGKTVKQKCLFTRGSLAWAAWVIARLGGWKGYASERLAGVKTFYWGLQKFHAMLEGRSLA